MSALPLIRQRINNLRSELSDVGELLNKSAFMAAPPMPGAPPQGMPPQGGPPVDPATGMPIDPNTGMPIDPAMMQQMQGGPPIDPNTGMPMQDPSMQQGPPPGDQVSPELLGQLMDTLQGAAEKLAEQGQRIASMEQEIGDIREEMNDLVNRFAQAMQPPPQQ